MVTQYDTRQTTSQSNSTTPTTDDRTFEEFALRSLDIPRAHMHEIKIPARTNLVKETHKETEIIIDKLVESVLKSISSGTTKGWDSAVNTLMDLYLEEQDWTNLYSVSVLSRLRNELPENTFSKFNEERLKPAHDIMGAIEGSNLIAEKYEWSVAVNSLEKLESLGLKFSLNKNGDILATFAEGVKPTTHNGKPVPQNINAIAFNDYTTKIELIEKTNGFELRTTEPDGNIDRDFIALSTSNTPNTDVENAPSANVVLKNGSVNSPVVMRALAQELSRITKASGTTGNSYIDHCLSQEGIPIIKPAAVAGFGREGRAEANKVIKPYGIELTSPVTSQSDISAAAAITIDSTYVNGPGNEECIKLQNGQMVSGVGLVNGVEKHHYNNNDFFRVPIKDTKTKQTVYLYVQPTNADLDAKNQSVSWENAIKNSKSTSLNTSLVLPETHIIESGKIPELQGKKFGTYTINETIQMKQVDITTGGVTAKAAMAAAGLKGGTPVVDYKNTINGPYSFCIADENGTVYFTGTMGTENMVKK